MFDVTFRDALADDLNISKALGEVFHAVTLVNSRGSFDPAGAARVRDLFRMFDSVLDILRVDAAAAPSGPTDAEIDALVAERQAARAAKDFARSDVIRKRLTDLGIVLEDTPRGPRWTRSRV
jgi:cysteinyl-tRNA synthetase